MKLSVIAPVLSRTPLFGRITSRADMAHLERVARRVVVEPGTQLLSEGQLVESIDLVLAGEVAVCFGAATVESLRLGPGSLFGEMEFFEKTLGLASVLSRRRTELVRLPYDDLVAVAADNPLTGMQLYHGFLNTMVSKHRLVTDSLVDAKLDRYRQQIAHDLRSPLAALQYVVGDARHVSAEARTLVDQVVVRMQKIIGELDGPGAPLPAQAPVFLAALGELMAEKRAQYRQRPNTRLRLRAPPTFAAFDAGPHTSDLIRVLSNLVDNAIEATPSTGGEVCVDVKERAHLVVVGVRDAGPGIPPAMRRRLGQQPVASTKPGGLGVGLFHAARRIERLGGRMLFDSGQRAGARVGFVLPARRLEARASVRVHACLTRPAADVWGER